MRPYKTATPAIGDDQNSRGPLEERTFAPPGRERSAWLAQNILPHEGALRAWLRRRNLGGLEIDDVVQETYAVLAGLAAVDHIAAPKAYAFQTALSLILRHARRGRIVRFETVGDTDLSAIVGDQPSPEDHTAARETLRGVTEAVSRLPPKCREAILLRKFEGLSQREVALRMGISESTVEKHIGRGLKALLDAIRPDETDTEAGRLGQAPWSAGAAPIRP